MYDNEAKPTEEQLKGWADATEKNAHSEVRKMIAAWAAKNVADPRMKEVIHAIGDRIASAYRAMAAGYDGDHFGVACKLTNLLLAAIEHEYGKDTADAIAHCL